MIRIEVENKFKNSTEVEYFSLETFKTLISHNPEMILKKIELMENSKPKAKGNAPMFVA